MTAITIAFYTIVNVIEESLTCLTMRDIDPLPINILMVSNFKKKNHVQL